MAKKKQAPQELTVFQAGDLVTAAAQLKVTLEVDSSLLREEVGQLTSGHATLDVAIKSLEVTDEDSYQACINLRNEAGRRADGLEKIWERYKKPLNAARQVVLDYEHSTVDVFTALKAAATRKAEQYLNEQTRAKRQAEEDLARLARQNQTQLNQEAQRLMSRGYVKEAEQLQMQAHMSVAPTLDSVIPKVEGAKVGTKFTTQVNDIIAFAKAIVEGKVDLMQEVMPGDLRPILVVDQVVLNAVVKRQMTALDWPGITVTEGAKLSSTGAR